MHPSSFHGESLRNSCSRRVEPPTCSAMFSTFFRSIGSARPIRYLRLHARDSERGKKRPNRAWNSSSLGSSACRSSRLSKGFLPPPGGSSASLAASDGEPYRFSTDLCNTRCSTRTVAGKAPRDFVSRCTRSGGGDEERSEPIREWVSEA